MIGDNNFTLKDTLFSVVAYNEKISPVQSENLPVNALGIYDNPAFGKTTANFATQLTLATLNPTIGSNPKIESVYLDVPYFSTKLTTDANGSSTYKLDSIYGDSNSKIKLSIYESGIDMDKDGKEKVYYSNQNDVFDKYKNVKLNDDLDKSQNDEFFFDPKEQVTVTKDADNKPITTYSAPGMHLKLNTVFFQDKIFDKIPSGTLSDQDVFDKYFRGLYFKVEQSGTDKGSLAMINFKKGTITIKYKEDSSTTPVTRVDKTLILNMSSGFTASLLTDINKTEYQTATDKPNTVLGDPKLYLKGGEGSMAVINLFNKGELNKIRTEGWLINQANLVFNIDANTMKDSPEPERLYLYDYTNSTTILDYYLGLSTTNKNTSKYLYGGLIARDATTEKRGVSYTFNITNHIRNLVKNNAVNVKLGLVVTEDINIAEMSSSTSKVPKASVMNPLGTILYGSNLPDTDSKRLQLKIYYTKPK